MLGAPPPRYLHPAVAIGIEPLARASEDELVAYYAPTLQRFLTGAAARRLTVSRARSGGGRGGTAVEG